MECSQCGKQLVKQKRFCSRKCFVRYKSENPNEYIPFNLKQWKQDNPELAKKAEEKRLKKIIGKSPSWKGGKRPPGNYKLPPVKRGSESPNWKGGKWIYWRKQVLKRDDYTCKICGLRDEEIMDVDHISPLRGNGISREDMKLADIKEHGGIENLQTLCPNCHKRKTIREANTGH